MSASRKGSGGGTAARGNFNPFPRRGHNFNRPTPFMVPRTNAYDNVDGTLNDDFGEGQEQGSSGSCGRKSFPTFGFKRLYGFLADDADKVIMYIDRHSQDWQKLIETNLSSKNNDTFILVIHILGEKVCTDSTLRAPQISIIATTLGQTFSAKWGEMCNEMFMKLYDPNKGPRQKRNENDLVVDDSRYRILKNLHKIFLFVESRMPFTTVDYVQRLLPGIMGLLSCSDPSSNPEISELQKQFIHLKERIALMTEKKNETSRPASSHGRWGFSEREEAELHRRAPPNKFRDISIVPSMEDLISVEPVFLRTNKKRGAYNDADHYLDVQFRLLREDFVRPLKNGIQEFMTHRNDYLSKKRKMPLGDVRIYPDVRILGVQLEKDLFTFSLQIPENIHKRIKWNRSKRLLYGSLLVLTPDNFHTAYFGVVAKRDKELKNGIIDVVWEGETPALQKGEPFLMIECEVYFEAYRHTLQILKDIELELFPMAKFIVQGSSDVNPPKYLLESDSQLCIDGIYFSALQGPWPNAKQLRLDESQFNAFHAALTSEFAIIQGPPGTGKTFLGLKIAEVFLSNLPMWWGNGGGPILVVCYTNHALDQFLEGLLDILEKTFPDEDDPAVIRVGGRSKSIRLEEFNLRNKREKANKLRIYDTEFWKSKKDAVSTVREFEWERAYQVNELSALGNPKGLINFERLTAWSSIKEEFPKEVLDLLKQSHKLGFDNSSFESPDFSAEDQLKRLFKIAAFPLNRTVYSKVDPPQNSAPSKKDDNDDNKDEAEDDAEEDYDIEELLIGRLLEDYITDTQSKPRTEAVPSLHYTNRESVPDYEADNSHIIARMAAIRNDKKLTERQVVQQLDELSKQTRVLKNKQSFLELLFDTYKTGRIDLPNIDSILNPTPGEVRPLRIEDIWSLFFAVVEKAKVFTTQVVTATQLKLINAQKKLKDIQNYGDGFLLRQTKIVGMTTTGAAKFNDLLKMMKSKIVIVEEAAEVLESHIVTCITQYCEHLILIGDHQQLRPSTTVFELSQTYNLDISLFERMLNNELHCHKLLVQHRMRPEICNLIVGTIYDELRNHTSVLDYPEVLGSVKNLFFLTHRQYEKAETDSMTKQNPHEAAFLTSLCRYLIQQGYSASQITVITTYTGQMFLIKEEIRKFHTCQGVRVTVVDNFQGEENDIILLSLVRSNEANSIGFLKTDNRICVAISRAKHGLFICGNMDILSNKSKTWQEIQKKLVERNEIGESMELICQIHGTITSVKSQADFTKVPEGGCNAVCETKLNCGHQCYSVCHIQDREHKKYECKQRCEKKCINNHQCQTFCFKNCPPCPILMTKTLPCLHVKQLECHVRESSVTCRELVLKVLPCGHSEEIACFKDPAKVQCKIKVEKQLPCSHKKQNVECHVDEKTITCKERVEKILIPCGHLQIALCHEHEEMIKCITKVEKVFKDCDHKLEIKCQDSKRPVYCQAPCPIRLDCGHACTKICHVNEDPGHLLYTCRKKCGRTCANGHTCATQHKCSDPCPPCKSVIEKQLSCKHTKELECHRDPLSVECLLPCEKKLERCGHQCGGLCFQACPPCMIVVEKTAPCSHRVKARCSETVSIDMCETLVRSINRPTCGHDVLIPCKVQGTIKGDELYKFCKHPCNNRFDEREGGCGHSCKGTCSECCHGRLHKKCQEVCERALVCGHVCTSPCSAACPPCQKDCIMRCEHSKCDKRCGEPCSRCAEKCGWKCEHIQCNMLCGEKCDRKPCEEACLLKLKCGHNCIGFCGEPCPPQCRICDKPELTEFILLGDEEDEDSRFVLLEDCGHAIERGGLDYYFNSQIVKGEIQAKCCPRCTKPITKSKRYGNIIYDALQDVIAVKKLKFGNETQIKQRQSAISNEVLGNHAWRQLLPDLQNFVIEKTTVVIHRERLQTYLPKRIDVNTLGCIELIVKHARDVITLLQEASTDLNPELFETLKGKYNDLFFLIITRDLPLNAVECRDFDREFQRLHDLKHIYMRKSSPRYVHGGIATPLYERALASALSPNIYTGTMKDDIYRLLKEIDDCLKTGLGLTDRERREVLEAIGMAQGRWFKCPNEHIYIITECGGAMEESKCYQCAILNIDSRIGGGSHRLRGDNTLATEMDGATQPLYPNMLG